MKLVIGSILILLTQSMFGQVTIMTKGLPDNHKSDSSIYISGDFEGWTGGQEQYKLTKTNGVYFITLSKQNGSINYKLTQGSWETVETDLEGNNIDNRTYIFSSKKDTLNINILKWANPSLSKKSTAASNVFVLSENFKIPQLKRERKIWIYLPPNYKNSNDSYPVLYMHDAQNIFDNGTSFAGEWQVDETLNRLYKEKGFKLIVVGVDNGGNKRLNEYSPWPNNKFGSKGQGNTYLKFIIETLKPFVDNNFRTQPDKKSTAIMGSSMGGLISHYAGLKYSQIFGKIGVFSPSFWYSKQSFEFAAKKSKVNDVKMYFLVGGQEGENMDSEMLRMIDLMKENGFDEANISSKVVPEGRHSEIFWRREFQGAILWLFKK